MNSLRNYFDRSQNTNLSTNENCKTKIDDFLRDPLINLPTKNRRRNLVFCFFPRANEQDFISNEICIINQKLPKELLLRIFSFLDYQSLCRCAQVSKVNTQTHSIEINRFVLVLEFAGTRWIQLAKHRSEMFST